MAIYLVAYDLINEKKGTHDYKPLWKELERLDAFRTQYSLWLINLTNTAKEVVEHFERFVDTDDRVAATKLRKGDFWWANATAGSKAWLDKNPVT
jgi:hypothetical protein